MSEEVFYHGHSISPFKLTDASYNIFYILGIVNSKLISWYSKYTLPNFSKDIFPKLNPSDIKLLPIKLIDTSNELTKCVIKILSKYYKSNQTDFLNIDSQIDILVYKLYELTWEEVKVVQPDFSLTEEEYENYKIDNDG